MLWDFDREVRALKDLCILGIAFALCRFSQSRKGDWELYSAKVRSDERKMLPKHHCYGGGSIKYFIIDIEEDVGNGLDKFYRLASWNKERAVLA